MSTMMTFNDQKLAMKFMTKDEIREKAPYVFSDTPTNPSVSKRYMFANTETIIDDMKRLGWEVVECKQQRADKRSNIRSFHMVAFQNPTLSVMRTNGDNAEVECYPRIILTNSHDGFNSFKFMVGLFRLVCSNGLIIATEKFADISIRHINYTFEELRKVVERSVALVLDNIKVMDRMEATMLSDEQKRELAVTALKIRNNVKDDEKLEVPEDEIEDILKPSRNEDAGDSLWSVFNVLQEKVIKGNYTMTSPTNGKKRKAREIKGAARDIEINQSLFLTASSYCAAA